MTTIHYCEDLPDRQQYFSLFETTGWNQKYKASAEDLIEALKNSQFIVMAYDGEQLVGCGRVLTDGVLHAMVYEMIVHPTYQGQGIGSVIINMLVDKCKAAGIRDIQLFAAKGKAPFYRQHGFMERPADAPGMALPKE
ncbi:MAG: GNAT family N-acetyltransferase [Anaerolineales bacterium]|nr:GNAT family N-acetyltransferase [Anaerolineales bacterium]